MNETIKIEMTSAEWQVVLNHVATGRYIDVAPLLEKMAAQIKAAAEKGDGSS